MERRKEKTGSGKEESLTEGSQRRKKESMERRRERDEGEMRDNYYFLHEWTVLYKNKFGIV